MVNEYFIFCNICKTILSDDDLKLYLGSDHNQSIFVCSRHRCECLPENIPLEWIRKCEECNEMIICKGCYRLLSNMNLCLKCY